MQTSVRKTVFQVTFVALFAALCYVSISLLRIPVGPMFIHFGNLIVVLAALLIGGWQGGLAGSIGMGLFDCLNGYAASSPKTFLLKFLIGFITGLVFCFFKKRLAHKTAAAIIGATAGMLVNLIGETVWRFVTLLLEGGTLQAAFAAAVTAQVSTLINAVVSIIGGVALFTALDRPVHKIIGE